MIRMASDQKSGDAAIELFRRMFEKAAANHGPLMPTAYVEDSIFEMALTKAGIDHPSNWIRYNDWKDEIGLTTFAAGLIRKAEKRLGIKTTKI